MIDNFNNNLSLDEQLRMMGLITAKTPIVSKVDVETPGYTLGTMIKVQITVSADQLKLLSKVITHSALYDKLLKTDDPQWIDLKRTIQQANDEVNDGVTRLASYKLI